MNRTYPAQVFQQNLDKAIDSWKFAKETGTVRDCRQDREYDARAGDGIVSWGQRTVSKNGSFRFAGSVWQCDLLIPLAGKRLGICAGDYWMSHIQIWTEYPGGKWLMTLQVDPGVSR